jgi:P27 family predicted phage terminase small subunit
MTRGRKPKPTALKILHGTNRRDRARDEPTPKRKIPKPPEHLTPAALAEWKRIAPELHELGLLTELDRAALAAYCQTYARWTEAEADVAKVGRLVRTNAGEAVANPNLAIADRALKQMHQFVAEFGMSPSSRTRVSATKSRGPSSVAKRKRA